MKATLVLCLAVLFAFPAMAWESDAPYDPAAERTAQEALARLGSNRGAIILLPPQILNIVGFAQNTQSQALSLVATSQDLQRTLDDLNAQVFSDKIVTELASDILFDFDKSEITPRALDALRNVAHVIQKTAAKVDIIGHTDSLGADSYNMTLSLKRAQAVKDWLIQKNGVDSGILSPQGAGETKPKLPNENPDGSDNPNHRAKNRRVEVIIWVRR